MTLQEIKSRREFEEELAKLGEEIRRTIELECAAFPTDPAASLARRERAFNDYRFFCTTYFPHYVPTPYFSLFHEFLFRRFPEVIDGASDAREVHMAPRGEAKSTYETQLGSLWCIVTNRKHMIGVIMNTEEQAAEMLEAIKAELDTNPRLLMDFTDACGRGRVWQATTAVTANNIKIRIGGTGKKIRGMKHGPYRPDLIFLDDLENDENVRDKAQRDKVEKYVLSAVLGLAGPAGGMDVFWVGTSLHYDAAINRVSRKPGWRRRVFKSITRWPDNLALWEKWESIYTAGADNAVSPCCEGEARGNPRFCRAGGKGEEIPVLAVWGDDAEKEAAEAEALAFYQAHKTAMDAGAIVSWPDVRSLYRLMCMRAVDHDAFNQEQQNEAGNDDAAPFRVIHFWVDRRNDWTHFGAIDPSLGKHGKGRDPSAILVGGLNRVTMVLDVVEADIGRRVPDMIISRALDLQAEYGCVAWAVETVQFQAFLFSELIKRGALRGIAFPGVPVMPSTDKALRIQSLQPHVANGLIRLHRSQGTLTEQLKFWPEADHDDGPDALEMLWQIAAQFGGEFRYTSAGGGRGGNDGRGTARRAPTEDWEDDD